MRVKLWGIRGSAPVSGRRFDRHGCATTCIEARPNSGRAILLDAGSGLLNRAHANPDGQPPAICVSHYHLDHILGLPFFPGIYDPSKLPDIYLPNFTDSADPAENLARLFDGALFPLAFSDLPPQKLHPFRPGESFRIGDALVETAPTCHAGGCSAFRVSADGATFAYSGDHEIPLDSADPEKSRVNAGLAEFLSAAGLVLADCHYSPADHLKRQGWGHSDYAQWRGLLAGGKTRKLVFCHYSPDYDDECIDAMLAEARRLYAGSGLEILPGREGMEIELNG